MSVADESIKAILHKAGLPNGRARPFGGGKFNDSYLVDYGKGQAE